MDSKELSMIKKVADVCRKYGKGFGIIGSLALIKEFKEDINLLVCAIDVNILRDGLKRYVEDYKETVK